jgi:hypothetical protein
VIGFVFGLVCGVAAMLIAFGFWLYDLWRRS